MAKGKQVEIKDLPILNVNGKNYYAFNVALRYLKQNNKKFKGMTQKKFRERYGEDSIFKLTGCGSWISVELFNELSCKMTKVVVKTLDQEIRWKQDGAKLGQLFFVKDEATAKAHQKLVEEIPTRAMESLEKFEAVSCDRDGEKLLNVLDKLIESCKDFHAHGHTSVRPHLYENSTGFLIGNGVLLQVTDYTYDYTTYTEEEANGWQTEKIGKLCRYVESFGGREEHMQEFVKAPIDFTGMTPKEAIIECWRRGLFSDDCDYMNVDECGSIDVSIDHSELLHIISGESYQLPSHLDKKGRLLDLTDILKQEGIE